MKIGRSVAVMGVMSLVACGGGADESASEADQAAVPADSSLAAPIPAPQPPAGTVDTAGVGVDPPTAGGQVVDTAAVPGAVDTAQGTQTAP
jgi:hypothetical protein